MKRFRFRLDSYLRVCEYREQSERLKLAELQKLREDCADLLASLQRKLRISREEFASRYEFFAYEGCQYTVHFHDLTLQIDRLERQLLDLDLKVRDQRERVSEARCRLRPVEKLRQRRFEEHRQAASVAEQREADDIFLQRRNRFAE